MTKARASLDQFTTGGRKAPEAATAAPQDTKRAGKGRATPAKPAKAPKVAQRLGEGEPSADTIATTIRLPRDAWQQAKILAIQSNLPLTRVLCLALDDYFEGHGLPRLATR